MRSALQVVLLGALACVAACDQPSTSEPDEDGVGPSVVLNLLDAHGRPVIKSYDEEPSDPRLLCAYALGEEPGRAIMSVSDPGGIAEYGLILYRGNASFDSYTPLPPASETVVTDLGWGIRHAVKVVDSPEGTVQVSALANFDIHGTLPMTVRAYAVDLSGHYTETYQFDVRSPNEGVLCGLDN